MCLLHRYVLEPWSRIHVGSREDWAVECENFVECTIGNEPVTLEDSVRIFVTELDCLGAADASPPDCCLVSISVRFLIVLSIFSLRAILYLWIHPSGLLAGTR